MAGSQTNILLIHADQHRADCLGAYGNRQIRTPSIDDLARDGVTFTSSFCTFPVCTPSRYSTMSGQYVWQHEGWTNCSTLKQDTPTFAKTARHAGYRTATVGKMHFTPTYLDVGFDEMILCEQAGEGRWDDDYHRYLMDLGLCDINDMEDQVGEYRKVAPRENYWDCLGTKPSNLPEAHHSTTWIADRALEQIRGWGSSGNVLMVGFVKPHHPMDPPENWFNMYDPAEIDLLPGWTETFSKRNENVHKGFFPYSKLTEKRVRNAMAAYYASISHIDHHVGRIIDQLKECGLYDNTMIVYTSDHGDYMGHQHMVLKGGLMYDSLVRVPLIIKYPDNKAAGTTYTGQVSGVDVPTTILSQLGLEAPAGMEGIDLSMEPGGRAVVYCERGEGRQVMVRTPGRKLMLNAGHTPELLFDLEKDPLEHTNVLADPAYATDVEELTAAAWEWRRPDDVKPNHINRDALVIDKPNVPPRDLSHRPAIQQYYREKMNEAGYVTL